MRIFSVVISALKYALFILLTFVLISSLTVLLLRWVDPPTTAFIQSKSTEGVFVNLSDYDNQWVDIDKVSPYFPLAVVAAEDQRFFWHNGFDFVQLQKAIDEMERGRRVRGASTITQQVAKNLFLWGEKSFIRKGIEAYFTVLIELFWSKKRILEVYINIAELGKNTYGIESASRRYLNKSSEQLTIRESALAASVLPNPLVRNLSNPSGYMLRRSDAIIKQINNLGGKDYLKKQL